jgi:hypothetical protein
MHYKNGREAKNGDPVLRFSAGEPLAYSGILISIAEGTDSCNGRLVIPGIENIFCVTIKECLHIDDIFKATIPDSTKETV